MKEKKGQFFFTQKVKGIKRNRTEGENIIVLISDIQVIRKILRKPPENLRLGMISKKR